MLSMQWFLARGLVEAHYLGAELRCISAIRFGDALLWCIITMQYCGALSRCVIAMFIAMHCLGAFCDALSQCIIAGRYRDAAVQFYIENFICGHLCDALSWGISRRFLKWGFGSKSFCCNTSGCIAIFG